MTSHVGRAVRWMAIVVVAPALLAVAAPTALAGVTVPRLHWKACGDGYQCATAEVPRDYARPDGKTLELAVVRLRAQDKSRRIGSLLVNFGGPGVPGAEVLLAIGKEAFGSVNDRFDIVSWDPRGIGQSEPAIDCKANQETEGVFRYPFARPTNLDVEKEIKQDRRYIERCLELNPGILPYVSTANGARDLDLLRAAVGDRKLTYLGYSYGTFLGANYLSLFPDRIRAAVLDGAVDAAQSVERPFDEAKSYALGFEDALDRWAAACAAHQDVCGFGGDDPEAALDALLARLDREVVPAGGLDPRPVTGDDVRVAIAYDLYGKQYWTEIATALAQVQQGDGTLIRELADGWNGWQPDGTFNPGTDRYFTISAADWRYPPAATALQTYLDVGEAAFTDIPHFWWNNGYSELNWGLYPVKPRGTFDGPFRAPTDGPMTLIIGTTHDPATPYAEAASLTAQLGNARLLTMDGDGHTASYGGNSTCIDAAVDAYLEGGALPAEGTVCPHDVAFERPAVRSAAAPRPWRPVPVWRRR